MHFWGWECWSDDCCSQPWGLIRVKDSHVLPRLGEAISCCSQPQGCIRALDSDVPPWLWTMADWGSQPSGHSWSQGLLYLPIAGRHHLIWSPSHRVLNIWQGSQPWNHKLHPCSWYLGSTDGALSHGTLLLAGPRRAQDQDPRLPLHQQYSVMGSDAQSPNHTSCHTCVVWQVVQLWGSLIRSHLIVPFNCTSARGISAILAYPAQVPKKLLMRQYFLCLQLHLRTKSQKAARKIRANPSFVLVFFQELEQDGLSSLRCLIVGLELGPSTFSLTSVCLYQVLNAHHPSLWELSNCSNVW